MTDLINYLIQNALDALMYYQQAHCDTEVESCLTDIEDAIEDIRDLLLESGL